MMATTHVLAGIALATIVAILAPEFALVAVAGAALGSVVPDVDVLASHRRTLHFPVYYSVGGVLAGSLALIARTPATVAVACFLLAAACHSVSDALGGGLEVRPWDADSDRAVYDHFRGQWIRPRRWIGYDGSPADLALAALLALVGLFVFSGLVEALIIALLVVSIGYTVCRKLVGARLERVQDHRWAPTWLTHQRQPPETDGDRSGE